MPRRYISALLLSLGTMLHLELPHVNVLSKVDLLRQYGKLGAWPLLWCIRACQHVHVCSPVDDWTRFVVLTTPWQ